MKEQQSSINLNKYISRTGICSRREADRWIEAGRLTLNGKIAQLGNRVQEGDEVLLDGEEIKAPPPALYIALNKPKGIVCTTDKKEKKNIIDFINHPERLFPIGRLDKPSEGLILLTNDGDIVNKILRAGNAHEKEYIVCVDKKITSDFIQRMSNGIPILGKITKKCKVEMLDEKMFRIVLIEGLNRQIRRMCEYLGYEVKKLTRVRIMNVALTGLKTGEWRELETSEMEEIKSLLQHSIKTEEASLPQHFSKNKNRNKRRRS